MLLFQGLFEEKSNEKSLYEIGFKNLIPLALSYIYSPDFIISLDFIFRVKNVGVISEVLVGWDVLKSEQFAMDVSCEYLPRVAKIIGIEIDVRS